MSAKNYIPKEGTQQSLFLPKYPEFDGRGIKIAIIDSDVVDASLPGFQKTSTGLPKITEIFPRKGITVNTSTIVESSNKRDITGLSGRKIKIPSEWKNPSLKWHIGSILVKDIMKMEVLTDFDFIELDKSVAKKMNKNKLALIKDEIADCIVWFDGEKWRACINTSSLFGSSDSEEIKVLANFYDGHEIEHFVNDIFYCVNISESGELLEIFCPLHYHGTSVAQVAAGYFPDDPEGSGLAPGAQIVSIPWDNMEQALLKCIECKVDIVNLSCCFYDFVYTDIIKTIIKKMVDEHGIILIQGAGNFGPFYSSIQYKRIKSIEEAFIIGSVYSSDVINKFNYSKKKKGVPKYSCKGPSFSGARGIDFVAPGHTITDPPKWYQKKNEYQYGTSLSTPNATGSIACLLSALKANKIAYSPAMIKMALANTAFLPEGGDRLAFGHGIIQIYDAFEFIKKSFNILPMKSLSPLFLNEPKQKGILLIHNDRNNNESTKSYYVNIYPEIVENWILKCTSSGKNFITEYKIVKDNLINVKVDPKLLEEGSLNYAEIHGIDFSNPSIGPLFYLPVTVICPAEFLIDKEIILKPGGITHLFFKSPSESQQCYIKITLLEDEKDKKLTVKHRQKNGRIVSRNSLKFTEKEKTQNFTIEIVEDDPPFELCFYHNYLITLMFKVDINF